MVNQIKAVSGEMEIRGMPDSFPAKGFKGKSSACFYVGVFPSLIMAAQQVLRITEW